ncbi:hypothetical protein GF371_02740 [Candidatus Woesearchaeota archaeon]|nr:hypothetical protein [Candidatus Woesearchaeota archaeon]
MYKNKILLNEMKIAKCPIEKAIGLMFASKSRIRKGMCLMNKKELRAGITTLFCFYPMELIFVNKNNIVVDKAVLKPWTFCYKPKKPYKFAVESSARCFDNLKTGARVVIQ